MEFAKWLGQQVFSVVSGGELGGDAEARTVDLQVGKTVFHDVPANMRTELWLSQLHRSSAGAAAARQYKALLAQGVREEVLLEIDKDTHRTFTSHSRLNSDEGQRALLCVLAAYAASDPVVGYTQGMNFLAGLLLTYVESEAEAFGLLYMLMHDRGLRELYSPDMALLQVRLWQLGRLLPPRLSTHLEAHTVLPVLYASGWLLTCYASDFPLSFAARVLDLVITDCWAAPMMKVAVGILTRCQGLLLEMDDFEVMVEFIRQDVPRWPREELQELLTQALSRPWTSRQLRVLEQINGAETVVEAVQRVQGLRTSTTEAAEAAAAGATAAAERGPAAVGEPSAVAAPAHAVEAADGPAASRATEAADVQRSAGAAAPVCSAAGADISAVAASTGSQAADDVATRQATPRTEALTEILRTNPLPLPPGSKLGTVEWVGWRAVQAQTTTQQLQQLPSARARIETDIGQHMELDQRLSCALSSYQTSSDAAPSGTTAPPASAATTAVGLAAERVGGATRAAAPPGTRQQATGGIASPPAALKATPDVPPPSPFDTGQGQQEGRWLPTLAEAGRPAASARDPFGSFTGATSSVALLAPCSNSQESAKEQPTAPPAEPVHSLQSFFNLWTRPAVPPGPSGGQQTAGEPGDAAQHLGRLGLSGHQADMSSALRGQQHDLVPISELEEFGSWKTATSDDHTHAASRASGELASTASGGGVQLHPSVSPRPEQRHQLRPTNSRLAAGSPRLTPETAGARAAQLQQVHAEALALVGRSPSPNST